MPGLKPHPAVGTELKDVLLAETAGKGWGGGEGALVGALEPSFVEPAYEQASARGEVGAGIDRLRSLTLLMGGPAYHPRPDAKTTTF